MVPMPYLPTVNAMAPNAPIGANLMTMPIRMKKTWQMSSISFSTGLPRSPKRCRAKANNTAKNRTCSMSPAAKAPTTVLGMIAIRKPATLWVCDWVTNPWISR